MPSAKPPGFQDCHMPQLYYKMYREAGIHSHSANCWLPLVRPWMWLPTHTSWAACCKQPKQAAAPLAGCCQGTAKNSGLSDCVTDLCPCQEVSKGWLGNSALQCYKNLLNRLNLPRSSPLLHFNTLLTLSGDVGQSQKICLCYCFLS